MLSYYRLKSIGECFKNIGENRIYIAKAGKDVAEEVLKITGRRKSSEYKLPVIEKVIKKILGN